MYRITPEQYDALRTALTMAAGGAVDPRVDVRGDKYTTNGGDSYTRDPRVAGVYAALAVLDAITPAPEALTYEDDVAALEAMTVPELRDLAEKRGLAVPAGDVSKAAVIDIIQAGEE